MQLAVALDTETTGFCEPEHRLVEVYLDLVDLQARKKLYTFYRRINPLRSMPAEAQRVHGISGADLLNEQPFEVIGPVLRQVLDKAQLFVAHNAEFDFKFLNMEFDRISQPVLDLPVFCTMEKSIWAAPTGKKPSLKELCFAMEVEYDDAKAHAAAYDVEVMTECLFRGLEWGNYTLPAGPALQMAA
ncbi:3'-5' exonuclease [Paracoccus litorisediminis]|uniref:3'-5' exonuclease n=1 Tax=Paracoccus litorisediminis TaxID=2006130 RepID=A0A844HUE8_9RHOB|nr:3'-5' exonuclease [Paracoccus litorisediminis]MTH61132.1 3'-5' exonuclease [Paracoccus litorisediminis]